MLVMTAFCTTPCMMVTVIISTRTPHMVARLSRAVGEVVQAMGAVDSMWIVQAMIVIAGMWAHSGLLDLQVDASGLKILELRTWDLPA